MGRFRLACHLIQFGGEQQDNPEKVLREVADAGWRRARKCSYGGRRRTR